ncbi:MAG: T9SS type A sorting domain-containing protein [Lacibacter sp.]
MRSVRMNGAGKVLIYPNPGRDLIQVILPADAGVMDLSLEDMSGKNVRQWNGITQQQMQLRNLQPGMYVLRIRFRNTGEQVVERVIVQ